MTWNRLGLAAGAALLSFALAAAASAKEHLYVGTAKCRSCHKKELIGDQYGEWQKGPHAKAFATLKGAEAVKLAKEKGLETPPHESPECLECHVTAHGVEKARLRYPVKATDGVGCESCHGPGNDYRKKKVMSDEKKSIAAGMWQPEDDEKICTSCHNDRSPSWDPGKYKLANGTSVGFDFEQAKKEIAHPIPKDVKGRYLELVAKKKAAGGAGAEEDEEDED
jgi:hypothetical protein